MERGSSDGIIGELIDVRLGKDECAVLSKSTLVKLLGCNRRNLSVGAERKLGGLALPAWLPVCTRFAFQPPCGSPAVSLLRLEEPLGLVSLAGLQMRAVCAEQLHKTSTLLHFHAG